MMNSSGVEAKSGPFWIMGDDHEEYGPVDIDELREWLMENRVGIDTPVRIGGIQSDWRPWQTYPELVVLLAEAQTKRRSVVVPALPNHVAAAPSVRILAGFVDAIFIFFIITMFNFLAITFFVPSYQMDPEMVRLATAHPEMLSPELREMVTAIGLFTVAFYFTLFTGATGQTPGKKLTGLRVVDAQGLTPTYRRALGRSLVQLVSIFVWFVGYIPMIVHPQRRALHDLVSGTYVMMPRRH
jgi:uncharacterized RDD family membrane protein YckC